MLKLKGQDYSALIKKRNISTQKASAEIGERNHEQQQHNLILMPFILLSNPPSPSPHQISHQPHHRNLKTQPQIKPKNSSPISLLPSYAQNGKLQHAHNVFDEIPKRTGGYIQHGHAIESLSLLNELNPFVVSMGLKACASVGNLDSGMQLHCSSVKMGYMDDLFVANGLVAMYSTCGLISYSRNVFERIPKPDLVSWSSMLNGFVKNGYENEALELFVEMARTGIQFDCYVLSIGLKVGFGIEIHCYMIKTGLNSLFLCNSLVEYYGKMGELDSMRNVFDNMLIKDLVSWNTIISCHIQNLCNEEALMLFSKMMHEGFSICDDFTLGSILHAVTTLGGKTHGREIHGYVLRAGFSSNSYVVSALIDMYIKCNDQDTVSIKLFRHFQELGAELDEFMVASILKSCSLNQDLESGRMFLSFIVKLGMDLDPFVISSLIDMYAKCEALDESLRVFSRIDNPSTVHWSSIIAAHCYNEEFYGALYLFKKMKLNEVMANEFTYTSTIQACIALGDHQIGKEIHCSIIKSGYSLNAAVVNALIYMYLGFSRFDEALKLSSSIPEDAINLNFLIEAFEKGEHHEKTLKVFHKIQKSNRHLTHKSACSVLNSCRGLVLLSSGIQAHANIIKRGLFNDLSTCNSLVNMYSKCGTLENALDAFNQLPDKNSESWASMISAYLDHDHPSKALSQFREMIRRGKSPNPNTFLLILEACKRMDLVDEAFRVFTLMIDVYKIDPSLEIYSLMVDILNCAGMFREAEHFIHSVIPFETNIIGLGEFTTNAKQMECG